MASKPAPRLPAIDSSAFSHAAYDPATRSLTVRFKSSGKTFRYHDVSEERGAAFEGADSKGVYFARQIKPFHKGTEVLD